MGYYNDVVEGYKLKNTERINQLSYKLIRILQTEKLGKHTFNLRCVFKFFFYSHKKWLSRFWRVIFILLGVWN